MPVTCLYPSQHTHRIVQVGPLSLFFEFLEKYLSKELLQQHIQHQVPLEAHKKHRKEDWPSNSQVGCLSLFFEFLEEQERNGERSTSTNNSQRNDSSI
mmetsp:Transcript_35646/g.82872  ORF Transcript_35646/g.82872 Transcript_35646/m.82872 type:complete len:98 (-) Transcript_35646:1244-1537(-)